MPPARKKKDSHFRKILLDLMEEKAMSIRDVAKIAGVSSSTIAGWRNGNTPDNFDAIAKLAKHFNLTVGFMLTGQKEELSTATMPITAVFDKGHTLFSGFAKIHIETLVPKGSKGEDND